LATVADSHAADAVAAMGSAIVGTGVAAGVAAAVRASNGAADSVVVEQAVESGYAAMVILCSSACCCAQWSVHSTDAECVVSREGYRSVTIHSLVAVAVAAAVVDVGSGGDVERVGTEGTAITAWGGMDSLASTSSETRCMVSAGHGAHNDRGPAMGKVNEEAVEAGGELAFAAEAAERGASRAKRWARVRHYC
jgi:hypothetical protein